MSKAHAKATDTPAQEAATQAASAAADTGATPVVQPAQGASAPDARHGHGGLYTMKVGRRVRVEQTQPETIKERK